MKEVEAGLGVGCDEVEFGEIECEGTVEGMKALDEGRECSCRHCCSSAINSSVEWQTEAEMEALSSEREDKN